MEYFSFSKTFLLTQLCFLFGLRLKESDLVLTSLHLDSLPCERRLGGCWTSGEMGEFINATESAQWLPEEPSPGALDSPPASPLDHWPAHSHLTWRERQLAQKASPAALPSLAVTCRDLSADTREVITCLDTAASGIAQRKGLINHLVRLALPAGSLSSVTAW